MVTVVTLTVKPDRLNTQIRSHARLRGRSAPDCNPSTPMPF
jgi:hypothetical protein